jgi:hypothetical protein
MGGSNVGTDPPEHEIRAKNRENEDPGLSPALGASDSQAAVWIEKS